MKTIVITGGASGIGKGIAMRYLKTGDRVIVIGSSTANGDAFLDEAQQAGAEDRAVFLRADLSLVSENRRIAEEVKSRFPILDILVFCATKHSQSYSETAEGLELTFALDYLSRFILSYALKESLDRAEAPVIMNICGTGMKGTVSWNDLQHKNSFSSQKVMMHGSRLNDLSGVAYTHNNPDGNIRYILYNPMAVQTPGMTQFGGPMMRLVYRLIAKPIEKAVLPIIALLDNPPLSALSAFREKTNLSLALPSYDEDNAQRLFGITTRLLDSLAARTSSKKGVL